MCIRDSSNAEVNGISSDASRIAGISSSVDSVNDEGATWLRSNVSNPVAIGFVNGNVLSNSSAVGAWSDGVVGNSGGTENAIIWDTQNGIQALPGTTGGEAEAQDVSADGEISVGISSHEVFEGAAYFWDSNGINRLDDIVEGFSTFQSTASSISPDGNFIGGDIVLIDSQSNFLPVTVVWEGADRTLRILTDSNGDFVQGSVADVSNSGYTTGVLFDEQFNLFGFIWNPDFTNGVEVFEDWLSEIDPDTNFPFSSANVTSIAEANGRLLFLSLIHISEPTRPY